MSKELNVNEQLASELVKRDWVNSVTVETRNSYSKDRPTKANMRIIAHVDGYMKNRDSYLLTVNTIISDPAFDGLNVKFDKEFYDTCIYLRYKDKNGNVIEFALKTYMLKDEEKAKLYSEISGCEMEATSDPIECVSWSCKVS
jgi:hypothetical protein